MTRIMQQKLSRDRRDRVGIVVCLDHSNWNESENL